MGGEVLGDDLAVGLLDDVSDDPVAEALANLAALAALLQQRPVLDPAGSLSGVDGVLESERDGNGADAAALAEEVGDHPAVLAQWISKTSSEASWTRRRTGESRTLMVEAARLFMELRHSLRSNRLRARGKGEQLVKGKAVGELGGAGDHRIDGTCSSRPLSESFCAKG